MSSEVITVDATAGGKSLTSTKYRIQAGTDLAYSPDIKKATQALITVENASMRFIIDPAVTVLDSGNLGHTVAPGQILVLESESQIINFRAVRVGSTSAIINVTYFQG